VNTRDTAARVRGVPRCVEIRYRTRTRQTRDLKPAGFPVPVTIPSDRRIDICTSTMSPICIAFGTTGLNLSLGKKLKGSKILYVFSP
jgi:hypothetical protein